MKPNSAKILLGVPLLFVLALAATSFAAPGQQIIAMSSKDALTCLTGACQMITEEAVKVMGDKMREVEALEDKIAQLRAELAKKPNPKYCL